MTKLVGFADAASDCVEKAGKAILLVCGIGILGSMICGVFSRTFLPRSFMWPEEVSRFMLIWATFVGGSVAMHNKGLVRFEFVINLFHGKAYTAAELLGHVFSMIFIVIFVKVGIGLIPYYMKAMGTTVHIRMIWPASGVLVGGVFMAVHMFAFICHDVLKLAGKEPAGREA